MAPGLTKSDIDFLLRKLDGGSYPTSDIGRLLAVVVDSAHAVETRRRVVNELADLPEEEAKRALADVARMDVSNEADELLRSHALDELERIVDSESKTEGQTEENTTHNSPQS